MIDPRSINLSDPKYLPAEKEVVKNCKAAASSDNAAVTYTMLKIMEEGGNAVDACIAGSILQAAIQPFMTNHTGTVTFLCYVSKESRLYQLDSTGTFPAGIPLHAPIPPGMGPYAGENGPYSCIPGFMPGMKALYERFGTLPWPRLCEEAVWWAQTGHHVSHFEAQYNAHTEDFTTYFPEGRRFYLYKGRMPYVGERFAPPQMAETLQGVMEQGADYMITGPWADRFIARAHELGWKIGMEHMTQTPPRWLEPVRFPVGDYEVVSLAPPQQQGIYQAVALGILEELGIRNMEPNGPEHLFYMGHALRLAEHVCGYTCDPQVLSFNTSLFLDRGFHHYLAKLVGGMMPKADLTEHMGLTTGFGSDPMMGKIPTREPFRADQPLGSCELSVVDTQGNWIQMMNTLQSGGIPGQVVGGIPMVGSHAKPNLQASFMQMHLVKGSRMRSIMGNTMVLKEGRPVMQLGTPANAHCTPTQVLCNLLFFGMEPYAAVEAPRMLPLRDGGTLLIEDRISPKVAARLLAMGVRLKVSNIWDPHMGSFQMCYVDKDSGALCTLADPRRCGVADGLR